ncbi:elongation factor G-like protein EF-G2 [Rhodococcus chondri]|uniref:Elongation factor G-like protein EF-G2 n=1 Tax=Rhodococcus chondri TaxID=3065941 RepID=A0ABU7JLP5_9NOCA|nr:elongation factor G-like protein EF-G2 [Rhodococcus sp. CC-R104]MEE2030961.1 elongation factor G-like protein EF-G2 [Rhodococcus sp. CC-R104]
MPDRTAARTRQAPTADSPDRIRNVVLVGASASGKTTLAESLAFASGAIGRAGRVVDGTTVSDYEEIEQQHRRSVQLAVLPLEWNGIKINLIDTPGHPDFDAELRAGLHAADAAVFVVSATDPITAATRALWRECNDENLPRAIVVSKLDIARHSYDEMLTECHDAFGLGPDTVRALFYPVYDGDRPVGSMGLLTGRSFGEPGPCPVSDAARESLVEAISGQDDTLMERFIAGEQLDTASLQDGLTREILSCTLHPTVPATEAGVGAVELLELITTGFPDPTHRRGTGPACDPDAPLAAQVVRVTGDSYVGRISLVRIYAGTLRPDVTVALTGGDRDTRERVPALTGPFGKQQRPVGEAVAGDLVCVSKLATAQPGDTLSDPDHPVHLDPWPMPAPLLPIAIEAHTRTDDDKLSQALSRLAAEDPAVRVEQNPDTNQVVLWCTGEAHAELVLDRLRTRHGVNVDTVEHRVPMRETFGAPAKGHGRLVKQSGGHGQYAVCDVEVEPLPVGSGVVFAERVVGGAVPRQFIPSVEKGVYAQAVKGVSTGYPLVDVQVTLVDGKAHSVDSSDAAFQAAAGLALRDAASHSAIRVLEPVAAVRITLPEEYLGAVLGDLSTRRGRVLGTESPEPGIALLRAEVPELELNRYPIDLRALTQGTADFARGYLRHEPMPDALAAQFTGENTGNGRS